MLKISDSLIKQLIEVMKSHVDFNQNTKNFLSNVINKKLDVSNEENKKYLDFLQKEHLIYNLKYELKNPNFSFIDLFRINDTYSVGDYTFCFYSYQKDQVLQEEEAPPLQDLRQGKNIVVLNRDIIVPCITYQNKPFCILPIKDVTKKITFKKAKGKVILYGSGLGSTLYNLTNNQNVTEIKIVEDNKDLEKILKHLTIPKINTEKTISFIKENDINDYDYIIIDDTYLPKEKVNELYKKYCTNKNVIFINQKTIENNLKIELFKQIIVFIGDPKNINKDSEIGEKLFHYLSENDFELNTLQDFFIFLDDNYKKVLLHKV